MNTFAILRIYYTVFGQCKVLDVRRKLKKVVDSECTFVHIGTMKTATHTGATTMTDKQRKAFDCGCLYGCDDCETEMVTDQAPIDKGWQPATRTPKQLEAQRFNVPVECAEYGCHNPPRDDSHRCQRCADLIDECALEAKFDAEHAAAVWADLDKR